MSPPTERENDIHAGYHGNGVYFISFEEKVDERPWAGGLVADVEGMGITC